MRPLLLSLLTASTVAGSMACATQAPTAAPPAPSTTKPEVRCRTVLEVRPGPLGTASSATPVQKCEPVGAPQALEIEPGGGDEAPLGAPAQR